MESGQCLRLGSYSSEGGSECRFGELGWCLEGYASEAIR
jgi:hypothetical protein